jgi:hypothetical protein
VARSCRSRSRGLVAIWWRAWVERRKLALATQERTQLATASCSTSSPAFGLAETRLDLAKLPALQAEIVVDRLVDEITAVAIRQLRQLVEFIALGLGNTDYKLFFCGLRFRTTYYIMTRRVCRYYTVFRRVVPYVAQ